MAVATQSLSPSGVMANPVGGWRSGIVWPTWLVCGSMAETVPSWRLATQTRSAPKAIPPGPLPTGTGSTPEVAGLIRSTALPLLLVTQTAPSP